MAYIESNLNSSPTCPTGLTVDDGSDAEPAPGSASEDETSSDSEHEVIGRRALPLQQNESPETVDQEMDLPCQLVHDMVDLSASMSDARPENAVLTLTQSSESNDIADALPLVPAASPNTTVTIKTPNEPVVVAGRMMQGRKVRVMLSSCECGMDILDDDKHDDSTMVIRCHTRGCETVWVQLYIWPHIILLSNHEFTVSQTVYGD
jgi:hypothetical protein